MFTPTSLVAVLALSASTFAAPLAPAQNSTLTPSTPSSASNNSLLLQAVQKCGARMNGKLPPFIPTGFNYSGVTRQYFVKAEEVEWDYVPGGWDDMRGVSKENTPAYEGVDSVLSSNSLGSKYIKALFKGYTSDNFTVRTEQPDWLGFQGPIMRAEVGDMIEVMLYNDLQIAAHPVSMHSMGLHYSPMSEGSDYYRGVDANGTAIFYNGSAIQTNECFVYKYLVTKQSQPDASQPSKLWSYHGDINLWNDVESGLFGPVLVYNRGMMAATMAKNKEYIMYYSTTSEYRSFYLNANIEKYLPNLKFNATTGAPLPLLAPNGNSSIWNNIFIDLPPLGGNATLAQAFMTINGFAFSTMPTLQIDQDDEVIWHMWSMGAFNDGFHAAHWHGNNVRTAAGAYMAQVMMLPATMATVTMDAANVGLWQLLCHVADHWEMGMEVNYNVSAKALPAPASSSSSAATSQGTPLVSASISL